MQKHGFWNSPKSLSRNEINKDRRLSLNCSKSRTCTMNLQCRCYFLKKMIIFRGAFLFSLSILVVVEANALSYTVFEMKWIALI